MKIQIVIFIGILLFSCSSSKDIIKQQAAVKEQKYNVEISLTEYFPYCGGAAPTEDMLNRNQPATGSYLLLNTQTLKKVTVQTDSLGIIKLGLNPGDYVLRHKYQDVSFKTFYQENSKINGQYYEVRNEECYKKWWKSNLVEFSVNDTSSLQLQVSFGSRCFTGNNPCLIYTGPYPP